MFDENLRAELIYDGTNLVAIPSTMENPAPGQMEGTAHERLGEVACRVCYESMGVDPETGKPKGRSSTKLHEHIKQVKNHSVYEHCTFTVKISGAGATVPAFMLINRPGIWFQRVDGGDDNVEVTLNHRSVLEWHSWSESYTFGGTARFVEEILRRKLYNYARLLAPSLYGEKEESELAHDSGIEVKGKEEDLTQEQAWISLYMSGSRGYSHEQVRHGDYTAISQRSTRFCDETDSPYVVHPLISYFLEDPEVDASKKKDVSYRIAHSQGADRVCYQGLVDTLQDYLKKRGVEGTNARKQARGAARGYLGNALFTDMVFSANCRQWRNMLSQRASIFADAEIRTLYAPQVLQELRSSQYGHFFEDVRLADSPDGIGQIAVWEKKSV